MTTKGEATAIGIAQMNSSTMISCDHGCVAKIKRVRTPFWWTEQGELRMGAIGNATGFPSPSVINPIILDSLQIAFAGALNEFQKAVPCQTLDIAVKGNTLLEGLPILT